MSAPTSLATAVRPFRALHYDPTRVELADVVAPPYDVIDAALRERLLERSPYNVVRLILPEPGCERAAGALLRRWLDDGIVVTERDPCIYWLEQAYRGPDGVGRVRGGVIATMRLDPYGAGAVRPHERTLDGPKLGRMALLREVQANLSPIFGIHDDPERRVWQAVQPHVERHEPILEVHDGDGTRHRLWRVCDGRVQARIGTVLAEHPVTIADGHHRYETALAYRLERRAAEGDPAGDRPYDFAPVYLASSSDPGLEIFPTHRITRGIDAATWDALEGRLGGAFELQPVAGPVEALDAALADVPADRRALGVWRGGDEPGLLAVLRDPELAEHALPDASPATRALDVAVVGALVLDGVLGLDPDAVAATDRIRYRRSAVEAGAAVAAEPPRSALAVLLRAPSVADVEAVAAAGETMPQKSTYFYPKILDGMVFHRLA